jgi:hypothetical protein
MLYAETANITEDILILTQAAMLQNPAAQVTPVVTIIIRTDMLYAVKTDVTISICVLIDAVMLQNATAQIAQKISIFLNAIVVDPVCTQIAEVILIPINTVVGDFFKADFAIKDIPRNAGMLYVPRTQIAITVPVAVLAVMTKGIKTTVAKHIFTGIGTAMGQNFTANRTN